MAYLREQTISPYVPDRNYSLGDNTGQFSDQDIGKAVKQHSSGYLELCSADDKIFGVVASVEPGTKDGHSIGAVSCDAGQERYAVDVAGTLTRGVVVVAATQNALGTLNPLAKTGAYGPPVQVHSVATPAGPHLWEVVEIYGSGAGRGCLIRNVG